MEAARLKRQAERSSARSRREGLRGRTARGLCPSHFEQCLVASGWRPQRGPWVPRDAGGEVKVAAACRSGRGASASLCFASLLLRPEVCQKVAEGRVLFPENTARGDDSPATPPHGRRTFESNAKRERGPWGEGANRTGRTGSPARPGARRQSGIALSPLGQSFCWFVLR